MTNLDKFIEKLREKLSIVDIVGKKVNWDYKKVMLDLVLIGLVVLFIMKKQLHLK